MRKTAPVGEGMHVNIVDCTPNVSGRTGASDYKPFSQTMSDYNTSYRLLVELESGNYGSGRSSFDDTQE